ncbi:fumarylacetoacetate hydrolase family protein [Pseudolysinimonas kribbensis]|uniref:2-hydroxyhepta-2,4-diene-1,7-dioate isomerase n=1 Tax=Pseudolysinimonas kribbensis TaxID=433641 RepID=A0ABQ6K988_9MICO|nr:fumarylacetoacetate hydrolase family protein [Pseudolysinimonas kribbensis]GMA95402.1 2-hydroxyhepta-2,4-diene-1,7-dioate isomerase [Pseudolysinimonas kribbensis]
MRFLRVGEAGHERPVVMDGSVFYDLRPLTDDLHPSFWASGGVARCRRALSAGALSPTSIEGERIGAAVPKPPSIICVGMNYAAHAAESGASAPEHVVVFFKKPNTVVGPNDPIVLPPGSRHTDWEVELAVVLGRELRHAPDDATALDAVAGYALANDLSEREHQLKVSGGQWSKGKSAAGFAPIGPWIATPDEVGDIQSLTMRSWVNGEPRQDSTTADMVFPVAAILRDLSRYMVLEAGDVVLTGTPEGVALSRRYPYLAPGDRVTMEIDGLGRIEQSVVEEADAA